MIFDKIEVKCMENYVALNSFIAYLTYERRLSLHTVVAYKTDLNQFIAYLDKECPMLAIEQVNVKILRTWVMMLAQQMLDNKSINRKIISLRTFYKFLQKKVPNIINPTLRLPLLKSNNVLPIFLREKELLLFLNQYKFQNTFEGWRDKLVLELLYGTGIRLSELLHLSVEDIDRYECIIKVSGKGNKERIIPFPKSLQVVINRYLNQRTFITTTNTILLLTNKGMSCYPMMIYRIVQKYLIHFTSARQYSPHVLRHTFATHLLNKGADLKSIKELLGHTHLATTQLYTHNSCTQLKKIFKQAHPRSSL